MRTSVRSNLLRAVSLAVVVALLAVLPWLAGGFRLYQFTLVAIYATVILGLNILTGYNGQFSLGHGALFLIGNYVTAAMIVHWNVPYWATLPAAGIITGLVAFLVGFPALRLSGLYLALATLGLSVAMPQIFTKWTSLSGGVEGVVLQKPAAPFGLGLTSDQWLLYLAEIMALVLFLFAWSVLRSRVGRAFVAIRDNPIAAAASGVSLTRYKTLAFGISGFYAGTGGGLAALVVAYVAPNSYDLNFSITLVIGMVVGGAGTILGSILGAVVVEFLPNYAQKVAQAMPGLVYGVVLLLVMYFMPRGIAGFIYLARDKARSLARRLRGAPVGAPTPGEAVASRPGWEPGKEVATKEH